MAPSAGAAGTNTTENTRLSVEDVKAQIMANCATLWPILQARKDESSEAYNVDGSVVPIYLPSESSERPKLNLITVKRHDSISANVVYEKRPPCQGVMFRGPDAMSRHEAFERLLAMTEEVLGSKLHNFMRMGEDGEEMHELSQEDYPRAYYMAKNE